VARPGIDIYRKAQMLAPTPRAIEAAAFSKATRFLAEAQVDPGNYELYAAALQYNRKLWTVLQADVADDANSLPENVKSDFLSLSLFVDRQTVKALASPRAEHLQPLIDINRDIARGLYDRPRGPDEGPL
jgi:flagellar protein FlaF